jgi:hypothetical protein
MHKTLGGDLLGTGARKGAKQRLVARRARQFHLDLVLNYVTDVGPRGDVGYCEARGLRSQRKTVIKYIYLRTV